MNANKTPKAPSKITLADLVKRGARPATAEPKTEALAVRTNLRAGLSEAGKYAKFAKY
ncbi:MAG: hypothetical protein IT379_17140 [Deltaproteobacteria bacterium]|nr:hypothetical protein [Deltaproteobacteria bacterium]